MCHSARSHSSTDTAKPQLPRANFASSLPEFSAGSMKRRHFQPSRTLQAFHSTHTGQPACSSTPPRTLPPRNLCRREAIKEAPQFFPSSDLVPPARQPLLQSAVAQRRHACQGKSLDTGRIIKPVSLSTSQKDQKRKWRILQPVGRTRPLAPRPRQQHLCGWSSRGPSPESLVADRRALACGTLAA
jgi:hypothetical protein